MKAIGQPLEEAEGPNRAGKRLLLRGHAARHRPQKRKQYRQRNAICRHLWMQQRCNREKDRRSGGPARQNCCEREQSERGREGASGEVRVHDRQGGARDWNRQHGCESERCGPLRACPRKAQTGEPVAGHTGRVRYAVRVPGLARHIRLPNFGGAVACISNRLRPYQRAALSALRGGFDRLGRYRRDDCRRNRADTAQPLWAAPLLADTCARRCRKVSALPGDYSFSPLLYPSGLLARRSSGDRRLYLAIRNKIVHGKTRSAT